MKTLNVLIAIQKGNNMLEEPYYYVNEVLKFDKQTKERRKQLIEEQKKEIAFLKRVLNKQEKVRELEKGEPDFTIRLKYAIEVLNIMEIKNFELNN